MGKNKFLDDANKPQTVSCMSYLKCRLCHILLLSCCSLLFVYGCVFPKIIVFEDPLTSEEHLGLGVAYEKRGEFDGAIKQYRLAARKLSVAYLYLGNAYFQKNELHEAEESYKEAIKRDAYNADAYNNLAWLYYVKGNNLDEAERLAKKALELNPSKKNVYGDTLEKIKGIKKP
jgi:tetratricopeptide (TPR) repeat protein